MKVHRALFLLVLSCAAGISQQQPPAPLIEGYVTRAAARDDFGVNGFRILCGSQTMVGDPENTYTMGCPQQSPWVGEHMLVFGKRLKGHDTVSAERISFVPQDLPREITGSAVIDRVLATQPTAGGAVMVRADGHRLLLPPSVALTFAPPLQAVADIATNRWIEYKAAPRADGVLIVQTALISPVTVKRSEDQIRAKAD
jgi:hypothetical protein